MTGDEVHSARKAARLTQSQLAGKLGVSQAYLSMVERGARPVSAELLTGLAKVLALPPTALPLGVYRKTERSAGWFKEQLGALGYPGFAYLGARLEANPAALLMDALDSEDLDARVVEGLPWVPVAFPHLDWDWLTSNMKAHDRQNRLGFLVDLSMKVAAKRGEPAVEHELAEHLRGLERSRLAVEDTFCEQAMTRTESKWLRIHRPGPAIHWNLLSDLKMEQLDHVFA